MKIDTLLKISDLSMILSESGHDQSSISKRLDFFNYHSISIRLLECIIPESISVLLLVSICSRFYPEADLLENSWLFLAAFFLTRFIWNITTVIHGLGHSIVRALVEKKPDAISISNIIENRSLIEFVQSFFPCTPTFVFFFRQQSSLWVAAGDPTPWKIRLKAAGGLLFNLIAL